MKKNDTIDVKQLWGKDLFNIFSNHINGDGWLTSNWADIIEIEIPKFDEYYNDNPKYKNTYQKMYLLDFDESQNGELIRPLVTA